MFQSISYVFSLAIKQSHDRRMIPCCFQSELPAQVWFRLTQEAEDQEVREESQLPYLMWSRCEESRTLAIGGPIHSSKLQGSSEEAEIALCSRLQYTHPLGTLLELPKNSHGGW